MQRSASGALSPAAEECQATRGDLADLAKIERLLTALNDRYANSSGLVSGIRLLAARCVRRAQRQSPRLEIQTVEHALSLIGNKGIEAELLSVLEDLTVLKAELEP